MAAAGSHLTNKYAEGYPGKRYYGGCNMWTSSRSWLVSAPASSSARSMPTYSPHSGAQANMAVFFAMLQPGDTVMGMNLAHGGHLSHGSPVNMSGAYFKIVPYGVDPQTERIDYDEVMRLAKAHKPKMIIAGASAYCGDRLCLFRAVCDEVGALLMVDMAHIAGLIAAGLHQSPVPYADFVTTTTHKTLRGPRGGLILCKEQYAAAIDKAVFPGIQGGPLEHIVAAKAVCFKGGPVRCVQGLPDPGGQERRGAGRGPARRGAQHGLRRHRQPPDSAGSAGHGPEWQSPGESRWARPT